MHCLLLAVLLALAVVPGRAGAAVNVDVLGRIQLAGYTNDLFVHDDLLFVVNEQSAPELRIYDVADPASPVLLSVTPNPHGGSQSDMHSLVYSNGLVYWATQYGGGGLSILDASDPTAPREIAFLPHHGGFHNFRLAGGFLFFSNMSYGPEILVLDARNPAGLAWVSGVDVPGNGFCHDVSVMDGVAWASMWSDGTWLLDVEDPRDIRVVRREATGPASHSAWPTPDFRDVLVCQEWYDLGCSRWDLSGPVATRRWNYQVHETAASDTIAHDVMVVGDFAYISYYSEGLRILDLSDPARPVEVASLVTADAPCTSFCSGINQWLEDGRLYFADMENGVWILEFRLPHDAPITLHAVKGGPGRADVILDWNHTGEHQYTVRRRLAKETLSGHAPRDVDGATRWSDRGVVPDGSLYFYTVNGPWK